MFWKIDGEIWLYMVIGAFFFFFSGEILMFKEYDYSLSKPANLKVDHGNANEL